MRWTAPGKLVIVGEYAVLDGAPAIVAAVDSGVSCGWTCGPERIVDAPDPRFVAAALDAVDAPTGVWRFDAWNPVGTESKAGLGSSAAATVVAVLAGLEARGRTPSAEEVRRVAHEVHHAVQGSGSGVDVAASAHGGVIRFEGGRCARVARIEPTVVWSGRSASTGPRVAQYLAWPDRARFVDHTRALVDAFDADPIGALRESCRALGAMAADAGIAYWTPGLQRIVALAEAHGGAAKPSGAGGGDSVVALLPDARADGAFRAACRAEGFPVLPVRVCGGATREGSLVGRG